MPEGDTVFRAAGRLRRGLAGKILIHSDFRVPRLATTDLSGGLVSDVRSRGKHLLIDVRTDETALSIHSHLKMEGVWQVHPVGTKWRRPAHQARVVLRTDTTEAVGFDLGVLELLADPDTTLAYLGPDLLGPDWDADEAISRIAAHPETPIGVALLDQRLMAGVGNEYRAEVCFLTGYLPSRPVGEVDVARVVELCRRLLWANRERSVRTTTGNTMRGAQLWVYGRRGKPCRRCSTPIVRSYFGEVTAERVVYHCPRCQT